MLRRTKNYLFLSAGIICIIIGFIGLFVPILPTTPLCLLASYFFAKSSKKFHSMLLNSAVLGPPVHDWEKNKVIRPRVKVLSSFIIVIFLSICIYI